MKRIVTHSVSFLLIALWVYAAVSKLGNLELFASRLRQQPLPLWSTPVLLWLLPLIEIMMALMLSLAISRAIGLLCSWIILLAFAVYVGMALSGAYGRIPCSCGGIFSFMQWKGHLVFNSIAALFSFVAWQFEKENLRQKYYAHIGKKAENP